MPAELLLSFLAVILGFIVVMKAADWFVQGAGATARNLGVSTMVIGLTVVGLGTSAPEILISLIASLDGNSGLAVGNALGSNITNIALVLGVTALVVPLVVRSETLRREYPMMFLVMLVSLMLVADGVLGIIDGVSLIIGLVLMLWWLVMLGKRRGYDPMEAEYASEIPYMSTSRALFWLVIGLVLLLTSSRALVWGAVNIAHYYGVSDLIIGLTIVALGTSLPELAASVMGALRKEPDIAIGNVIGSNMFNLLVVLGIPGLLGPVQLDAEVLTRDFPYMIGLSVALFLMAYGFRGDGRINRIQGSLLLLAYIAYLALLYYAITGQA